MIWKTPDQKPEPNKQICVKNKFNHIIYFGTSATAKPGKEWAYVDDLIAQADKAERLQKAVDELWLDIDRHFAHQRGTKTPEYVSTQKLGELRAKLWEIANDTRSENSESPKTN